MNILHLSYCSGQNKELKLPDEEAKATDIWKAVADNMLMRIHQPADEFFPAGHLVRVTLLTASDVDPNDPGMQWYSVYRVCADIHPEILERSKEPKLYVTGAVA